MDAVVQVGSGEAIVQTPADETVRAFVQDVDWERVLRVRARDRGLTITPA